MHLKISKKTADESAENGDMKLLHSLQNACYTSDKNTLPGVYAAGTAAVRRTIHYPENRSSMDCLSGQAFQILRIVGRLIQNFRPDFFAQYFNP